MHEHMVLIDGYNVIRRSPQLAREERRSLQHGRDALITLLAARYGTRAVEIVVVFDGADLRETRSAHLGISIVYSAAGCTADACILRLAAEAQARGQRVTVATDDAGIRLALGSIVPSATHQSAARTSQDLYAADRTRTKQYRHRAAIRQILAADEDDDPPHASRRRKGRGRK
jgi:predicted RNA-binding protein with PIN domain